VTLREGMAIRKGPTMNLKVPKLTKSKETPRQVTENTLMSLDHIQEQMDNKVTSKPVTREGQEDQIRLVKTSPT
jgi:hypothetical protein